MSVNKVVTKSDWSRLLFLYLIWSDTIKRVDKVCCFVAVCCMPYPLLPFRLSSTRRYFSNWSKFSFSIDIRYLSMAWVLKLLIVFRHDQFTPVTPLQQPHGMKQLQKMQNCPSLFVAVTPFGKHDKHWDLVICQSSARNIYFWSKYQTSFRLTNSL